MEEKKIPLRRKKKTSLIAQALPCQIKIVEENSTDAHSESNKSAQSGPGKRRMNHASVWINSLANGEQRV